MSSLNESIVEDTALEWFGELGYAVGHGPHLAPGEPAAERDSFSEVVQFRFARTLTPALSQKEREKCEAIRRLNPAISSRSLATLRDTLLPKLLSGELSLPAAMLAAQAGVRLRCRAARAQSSAMSGKNSSLSRAGSRPRSGHPECS